MSSPKSLRVVSSGLIVSAALVVACSQASSPTKPTTAGIEGADGRVGASAVGDAKTGTGNLEIIRVRATGTFNAQGEYANPFGTYRMPVTTTIELWVEWDANNGFVPSGQIPRNPRLTITWGLGEGGPEDINCGNCKLSHRYLKPAIYTVTVTLDDLSGTRVTRTFFLDSTQPAPASSPTATPTPSPSPSPQDN